METEGAQETGQRRGRGRFSCDSKRMGLVEHCHAALQHRIPDTGAIDDCSSGTWSDGGSGIGSSIIIECNGSRSDIVESEGIGSDDC